MTERLPAVVVVAVAAVNPRVSVSLGAALVAGDMTGPAEGVVVTTDVCSGAGDSTAELDNGPGLEGGKVEGGMEVVLATDGAGVVGVVGGSVLGDAVLVWFGLFDGRAWFTKLADPHTQSYP